MIGVSSFTINIIYNIKSKCEPKVSERSVRRLQASQPRPSGSMWEDSETDVGTKVDVGWVHRGTNYIE